LLELDLNSNGQIPTELGVPQTQH